MANLTALEDLTGPLANDDAYRLERFSPKLLDLVLTLLKRAHARGRADGEAEGKEVLASLAEEDALTECPDCGWSEDDEDAA